MLLLNKKKKKYKKTSKHAEVADKRELFVKVLSGMEADQQLDGVDSIESYTRTWTQMIDHGDLYQVKDDVSIKRYLYGTLQYTINYQSFLFQFYTLVESIEKVTRHHHTETITFPIQQVIIGDALKDHAAVYMRE